MLDDIDDDDEWWDRWIDRQIDDDSDDDRLVDGYRINLYRMMIMSTIVVE